MFGARRQTRTPPWRSPRILTMTMRLVPRTSTMGEVRVPYLRMSGRWLAAHGFSDDDAWDIAAISAFFALSNRMANVTAMRPNDEFYLMGRLPKA